VYRTEEGVREHGRLHYQQDCITDSCFNKVDPEEPGTEAACPSPCPHAAREVHYHCRMVSSIVYHTKGRNEIITGSEHHWVQLPSSIPNPHPDSIQIQTFDDKTLKKKNTAENFLLSFFDQKLQLVLSKLYEKPSALKREHPALQKMQFINFFLCLWVIFALLDPDPDC
jgi:hypothetical protein